MTAPRPLPIRQPWGILPDGRAASLYVLENAHGTRAEISDFGGTIVRLFARDRSGVLADVVLGYNTLAEFIRPGYSPSFGCLIGRFGNRIAHGRFTLDGTTYELATNNAPADIPCHLHGGLVGFDKVLWQGQPVVRADATGLRLTHRSPDGDQGYPGNLDLTVTYWLDDADGLVIEYEAVTDRATPINLTNHAYFNLRGEGDGDVLDHELTIHGRQTTAVNAGLIPTGALAPVAGTPFDFTTAHRIGERIRADDAQLRFGGGYDHNWVLDAQDGTLTLAAVLREPVSGRVLETWTTEPGVQCYTANFLSEPGKGPRRIGKRGVEYLNHTGVCLETQHYPDSPNHPQFPSTILRPGAVYRSTTVYRFRAE